MKELEKRPWRSESRPVVPGPGYILGSPGSFWKLPVPREADLVGLVHGLVEVVFFKSLLGDAKV